MFNETDKPEGGLSALKRARVALDEELTVDVPTAMVLIGQGEHTVRAAIARGDIASVRIGRSIRVLTAPLRRQLGLD